MGMGLRCWDGEDRRFVGWADGRKGVRVSGIIDGIGGCASMDAHYGISMI